MLRLLVTVGGRGANRAVGMVVKHGDAVAGAGDPGWGDGALTVVPGNVGTRHQ